MGSRFPEDAVFDVVYAPFRVAGERCRRGYPVPVVNISLLAVPARRGAATVSVAWWTIDVRVGEGPLVRMQGIRVEGEDLTWTVLGPDHLPAPSVEMLL